MTPSLEKFISKDLKGAFLPLKIEEGYPAPDSTLEIYTLALLFVVSTLEDLVPVAVTV